MNDSENSDDYGDADDELGSEVEEFGNLKNVEVESPNFSSDEDSLDYVDFELDDRRAESNENRQFECQNKSTRLNLCSYDVVNNSTATFDATKFLSREELAKSIMKPCCKDQCLRRLSPSYSSLNFEPCFEVLHSARKQ